MREIFLTDLVRNILGPRNGPEEEMVGKTPLMEYITGILAPITRKKEIEFDSEKTIPSEWTRKEEGDEDSDDEIIASAMLSPALNPEKIPSTMGISFFAESSTMPEFDICITWARYLDRVKDAKTAWKRHPRFALLQIGLSSDDKIILLDSNGKISDRNSAEISIHPSVKNTEGNQYLVSIFVVNRIRVPEDDDHPTSKHHIFQPQIRIEPKNGTRIVPRKQNQELHGEEAENEFLYRNRPFLARGHLTSAVWRAIDPEIFVGNAESLDFPKTVLEPGLKWADGYLLQKQDCDKFSKPAVRTEYVPSYSIPTPSLEEWHGDNNEVPEWSATKLAEMWNVDDLVRALAPFDSQYDLWISKLEKSNHDPLIAKPLIQKCRDAHKRIQLGIDLLKKDDDTRLAFCFASKAMEIQYSWKKKEFRFRPFQMAFILMSLESILNKNSQFKDVCDLLWVPTGAGKTEAYLFLVLMTVAYRRLRSSKIEIADRSGAGVSVITRYTLRLLTIQQFRRSLSAFAAAEVLRVDGLNKKNRIGWRPAGFKNDANLIWGSTPFSVGLWVGQSVTPNKLESTVRSGKPTRFGAIDILQQDSLAHTDFGEPAQVTECPACVCTLAIPEMGLQPGEHRINFAIKYSGQSIDEAVASLKNEKFFKFEITEASVHRHLAENFATLSLQIKIAEKIEPKQFNMIWRGTIEKHFSKHGAAISLESVNASRPGYFFRSRIDRNKKPKVYDFEIICPNPSCPLRVKWIAGSPMGSINARKTEPLILTSSIGEIELADGNNLKDVQKCFEIEEFVSDRVPIPAYTVDDQIYRHLPSMVVSTVDKFARLPFEPKVANIFGNVDHHHCIKGYYRFLDDFHPEPRGARTPYFKGVKPLQPPDMIIQDELHLIDGPLGSMVGIYEAAIDMLGSTLGGKLPKYIASTATIRRAEDHVKSLFMRSLQIFPPKGLDVDDRFFIVEKEGNQLEDKNPGRLYVGVCAPGRGALTPIVRLWSRLAQTAYENRTHQDIDNYWTLTGYFNAVRELAGVRALYRGDIREWMRQISDTPRDLPEDASYELSGRTPSNNLPSILEVLNKPYPDAPDALFTTSMFGTGVDISRIGLMIVNGQPKTTSSYIQSTGRVGRSRGALVVTFFRATRPRDLSHYEFFARHHRQLHRSVEPPTVSPFASGTLERALGPICVSILRNMRRTSIPWGGKVSAPEMENHSTEPEIIRIIEQVEKRSQSQPPARIPEPNTLTELVKQAFDNWRIHAQNHHDLVYTDYEGDKDAVVLGSSKHEYKDDVSIVFSNVPQSLREIEEETGFQT